MKMSREEEAEFLALIRELLEDPKALEMKKYIQHGRVTTWHHCLAVARESFLLARRLHLRKVEEKALVRAAFLHDYFLYDWHDHGDKLHGFHHPGIAAKNAARDFSLNKKEENIIRSHMWPLTIRQLPLSREAALVCVADKLCTIREALKGRKPRKGETAGTKVPEEGTDPSEEGPDGEISPLEKNFENFVGTSPSSPEISFEAPEDWEEAGRIPAEGALEKSEGAAGIRPSFPEISEEAGRDASGKAGAAAEDREGTIDKETAALPKPDMRLLFQIDSKNAVPGGTIFSRPSCRAIIIRSGKAAMLYSRANGYYIFPGGGIERGESPLEALVREVQEESGLIVRPETAQPFGYVRRFGKNRHPGCDNILQDQCYYLCKAEDRIGQRKMDPYEEREDFVLEYVNPETAIRVNRTNARGFYLVEMLERDARILEILLEEGYFAKG